MYTSEMVALCLLGLGVLIGLRLQHTQKKLREAELPHHRGVRVDDIQTDDYITVEALHEEQSNFDDEDINEDEPANWNV